MTQVAVDQTVEEMANIESALSAGGVRVAYDVDRAAVGQQIVELGVIGELVDPFQIDKQEAARIVSRRIEAIKIRRLAAMIGSHAHEVALAADHVNQFELLEQGGNKRKAFADFRSRLDRDGQRRCIVENEAEERVPNRPLGKIGNIEIDALATAAPRAPHGAP